VRSTPRHVLVVLSAALACADAPSVEVQAAIGPDAAQGPDPIAARRLLAQIHAPTAPAPTQTRFVATAPRDADDLDALVEAIRAGPDDEVGSAARNLAATPAPLWPQLRALLLAARARPKGEYVSVLSVIGGDVPNRYGHFALHWKKAHGYPVRVSEDWYEDLLALPSSRISPALAEVYRDTLLTCAALRAAAAIGASDEARAREIVDTLLDAGYIHAGTFRDEVSRALASVGPNAIATLLRASVPPDAADEESTPYRRAQFARFVLDKMDRTLPGRAVEAVADRPALLRETLAALGETRDPEAASVLLAHVDVPDPAVRLAARTAVLAWVEGPAPTRARRTLRLLGGGTTTGNAHLTYRGMIAVALRKKLEEELPAALEPPCAAQRQGVPDPECEAQPRRHAVALFEHLDRARASRRDAEIEAALAAGDPTRAVEHLDEVLTDVATSPRAREIAQTYAKAISVAQDDGDLARAARLERKRAVVLAAVDPGASTRARALALVAESQLDAVDGPGRRMLLRRAVDLAPGEPRVVAELARAGLDEAGVGVDRKPLWRGLALLALGLSALWILGGQLRQPRVR
jgi:hypothetical protein